MKPNVFARRVHLKGMKIEHDAPTGRDMLIDHPLRDTLASIEDLARALAADAEAAREHLLFGERDAADAVLRRIEECGPQLAALRDRLAADQEPCSA